MREVKKSSFGVCGRKKLDANEICAGLEFILIRLGLRMYFEMHNSGFKSLKPIAMSPPSPVVEALLFGQSFSPVERCVSDLGE